MDRPVLATGLAATSFVSIRLAAPLTEPAYQALMEIPGVQPWWRQRREILVPYSAASIVAAEVERLGLAPTIRAADVPPVCWADTGRLVEEARALEHMVRGGLQPWTLENFAAPWQRAKAQWWMHAQRGMLIASPGAGKTLVAAMALCGLRGSGTAGDGAIAPNCARWALYVCPTATIRQTVRELARFTSLVPIACVSASSRRKADPDPMTAWAETLEAGAYPVLVVGWESLTDFWPAWAAQGAGAVPFAAIFDEVDMGKASKRARYHIAANGKGLEREDLKTRSATAAALAKQASAVLGMTGTPVADSLRDLWGELTLVEPDGWGTTDKRYLIRYCDASPGAYGGLVVPKDPSSPYLPELQARIAWTVQEVPYDVTHGHLPPKRRVMLRVPVEQQRAEVTGYARELNKTQDEDRRTFLRLALAASRKRAYMVETLPDYLTAGKGKAIVFTGIRKDADAWAAALSKAKVRGAPLTAWSSHGDATATERDETLKTYMAHPGPCVLCVTWQAWGVGLNLDDTDVIVFAMLPFRPRDIEQAEGRGDRASMTRPLLYLYVVAEGTADEHVIDLVLAKVEAVKAVVSGSRLDQFGGLRSTLVGLDQADDLQAAMRARMEADPYADAE